LTAGFGDINAISQGMLRRVRMKQPVMVYNLWKPSTPSRSVTPKSAGIESPFGLLQGKTLGACASGHCDNTALPCFRRRINGIDLDKDRARSMAAKTCQKTMMIRGGISTRIRV